MFKVYGYSDFTRDVRPRLLLEELGLSYETIRLDLPNGEGQNPDYLKINPLGKVPALVSDDVSMTESVAMVLYLADHYNDRNLAPNLDSEKRAEYLQWVLYAATELDPASVDLFAFGYLIHKKPELFPGNPDAAKKVEEAKPKFHRLIQPLETALADRKYVLGEEFSAADVLVSATLFYAYKGAGLSDYPNTEKYFANIKERPAFKNVFPLAYEEN